MNEFFVNKSDSKAHWLENLDKIKDASKENYFSALPDAEQLKKFFKQAFIIHNPKEKVGRDGFWIYSKEADLYLLLFTCEGKGHLANMVIRIYMSALKKMIERYTIDFPSSMLQFLDREVLSKFKNKKNILLNTNANVGIVKINTKSKKMEFSGAGMNFLQVKNETGSMKIVKGDEHQLGENAGLTKSYSSTSIENSKSSTFYLCSTGVLNLIGGEYYKKLSFADLGETFRNIRKYHLVDQKIKLNAFFKDWVGIRGQSDDIMVIGFRL